MLNYQRVPSWLILAKCIVQLSRQGLLGRWWKRWAVAQGGSCRSSKDSRHWAASAPFFCGLGVDMDWHGLKTSCRLLQIVADYEIMAGKNVRICCIIWSIRKLCSAAVLMDWCSLISLAVEYSGIKACQQTESAVSWGCDREQGGIPIAVLLISGFERKHQRSDSPLGDPVSKGCNWQGHGGHHQGEWHDSWYQGGQGLQQEAWNCWCFCLQMPITVQYCSHCLKLLVDDFWGF